MARAVSRRSVSCETPVTTTCAGFRASTASSTASPWWPGPSMTTVSPSVTPAIDTLDRRQLAAAQSARLHPQDCATGRRVRDRKLPHFPALVAEEHHGPTRVHGDEYGRRRRASHGPARLTSIQSNRPTTAVCE